MNSPTTIQRLEDATAAFVGGILDAAGLEDALADLAIDVSSEGNPEAQALHGQLWRLLSEYDLGHRDEASLRRALQDAAALRRAS